MHVHTILQQDPESWRLFTCEEEYVSPIRDAYDRFPRYASSNRNPFEPRASQHLFEQGFRPEYPEGQPFAVCLTHDIDVVYQSAIGKGQSAISSLKAGKVREALEYAGQIRSKRLPRCNFGEIMALEEEYGGRSSFYFLCLAPGDRSYHYDVRDLEGEIGAIADAGWEIGLHGGHVAYCDPGALETEKKRLEVVLNRPVIGYRSHFLRFRVPETWEHLSQAGFHYDATLGYADCAGFRNGMCYPFEPFDLRTNRPIRILEIPLAIMDSTLDQYMRLDGVTAWETARNLIDAAERCHGVITILWHNTSMFGDQRKLYQKILGYCRGRGAWMTNGAEVCSWWKQYV